MKVPDYVWKSLIVLLFIHEAKLIYETYKDYQEEDKDEIPECVKHMYC